MQPPNALGSTLMLSGCPIWAQSLPILTWHLDEGSVRADRGSCLQCHCSNSSPNLWIFSFPASKATRAFLIWKCGVCAALLTFGLQRKARIGLGNNCFGALWCNKAWIKTDAHLVRAGVRNNQCCKGCRKGRERCWAADTEI